MKKSLLFCVLLGCLNAAAQAENGWRLGWNEEQTPAFQESEEALPPVPEAGADWFSLYVSPTYQGEALIFTDSVHTAADGTVRYILNRRSAAGSDNISAEGLYCFTGNRLLGSDGAQVKTFAFADRHGGRWLKPRRAEWQVIGGKMNNVDKVRGVLYEAFCLDGRAKNDAELRARLRDLAGAPMRKHHDK